MDDSVFGVAGGDGTVADADAEAGVVAASGPKPAPAGPPPAWLALTDARRATSPGSATVRTRSVVLQVLLGALAVLAVVSLIAAAAARHVAEQESITDAATIGDLLGREIAEPAVTQALLDGDPAAIAQFDAVMRSRVLPAGIFRVKLWTEDGRVVYSDESRLIGQQFELEEEEREILASMRVEAHVSDVAKTENQFETQAGQLLEVYRPIFAPSGQPLLFEVYSPYDQVTARIGDIWRNLMLVTAVTLFAFVLLMIPLLWRLLRRLRMAQQQREALLQRAVDASTDERRRIAATLHDGVVQELAATSFTVAGAADRAETLGQGPLAEQLERAATAVRASIRGLRSLLVDIYPPSLASSGLAVALNDLVEVLRARDVEVTVVVDPDAASRLDAEQQQLVYRVAQECVRNVARHASARHVTVGLVHDPQAGCVRLEVADDGRGFDADAVLQHEPDGHFGVRILRDLSATAGAGLAVATAPSRGCRWRLEVPVP